MEKLTLDHQIFHGCRSHNNVQLAHAFTEWNASWTLIITHESRKAREKVHYIIYPWGQLHVSTHWQGHWSKYVLIWAKQEAIWITQFWISDDANTNQESQWRCLRWGRTTQPTKYCYDTRWHQQREFQELEHSISCSEKDIYEYNWVNWIIKLTAINR